MDVRLGVSAGSIAPKWIKRVVSQTLASEGVRNKTVSVYITHNREIRRLNRAYLKHDYATDVISFWAREDFRVSSELNYLGDLVVSAQMAENVAKKLAIPYKEELARYLVHGALHLLGYDDKKMKDKRVMFEKQEKIVRGLII